MGNKNSTIDSNSRYSKTICTNCGYKFTKQDISKLKNIIINCSRCGSKVNNIDINEKYQDIDGKESLNNAIKQSVILNLNIIPFKECLVAIEREDSMFEQELINDYILPYFQERKN